MTTRTATRNKLDNVSPLDLPEIIAMVTQYLDRRDLTRCMLIDRTWHSACLAAIWKDIDDLITRPTLEGLEKHRALVRTLKFTEPIDVQLAAITFPNLQSVDLGATTAFSSKAKEATSALLSNNLSVPAVSISRDFVDWKVIPQMKGLKNLTVYKRPHGRLGADFWNVCARLDSLDMDSIPEMFPIPRDISFPNLTSLVLRGTYVFSVDQLGFLSLCPNLKKLVVPLGRGAKKSQHQDFARLASANTWPKLSDLNYSDSNMPEDAIITLLENPVWKKWIVTHSKFGSKAFESLRNHFATLEVLSLQGCVNVTSEMVQEILSHCPSLGVFKGDRIHARDIDKGPPWVCTSLREFCCFVDCSGLETSAVMLYMEGKTKRGKVAVKLNSDDKIQQRVFEMFSRLTKLRHIKIGSEAGGTGLQFLCGRGLELLEDCKDIREIDFDGVGQNMTEQDVFWMLDHWKSLLQVRGILHRDTDIDRRLSSILFECGCQLNDRDFYYDSDEEWDFYDGYYDDGYDPYDDGYDPLDDYDYYNYY
ncbi:hypothetical protein B0O80DRAFT_466498 [Mortierella sp. GBAus27b]|nr:hypothetical protein BGX31_006477 [Mortierella sp. GBA43]KAI8346930.1 hypothetical protein B0O80DRAFT_466498 [Mortierella sp. GBAus27b]